MPFERTTFGLHPINLAYLVGKVLPQLKSALAINASRVVRIYTDRYVSNYARLLSRRGNLLTIAIVGRSSSVLKLYVTFHRELKRNSYYSPLKQYL